MAIKSIKTDKGDYQFNERILVRGVKLINKEQSQKNLLLFKSILDKHQLKFGLIYGTLLGAVREKDFIGHDEDVDTFMLEEDKVALLNILFELKDVGLEVVRYDGHLLSLMQNEDYIDIYFFKKRFFIYRMCDKIIHHKSYLEFVDKIDLFGEQFWTTKNPKKFLKNMYGSDWRIPIQNKHAKPYVGGSRFRHFLRKHILDRILKR